MHLTRSTVLLPPPGQMDGWLGLPLQEVDSVVLGLWGHGRELSTEQGQYGQWQGKVPTLQPANRPHPLYGLIYTSSPAPGCINAGVRSTLALTLEQHYPLMIC